MTVVRLQFYRGHIAPQLGRSAKAVEGIYIEHPTGVGDGTCWTPQQERHVVSGSDRTQWLHQYWLEEVRHNIMHNGIVHVPWANKHFTQKGNIDSAGARAYKDISSMDWCSTHDFVLQNFENSEVATINKSESMLCSVWVSYSNKGKQISDSVNRRLYRFLSSKLCSTSSMNQKILRLSKLPTLLRHTPNKNGPFRNCRQCVRL